MNYLIAETLDRRPAVRNLTYPGDVRSALGTVVGPNTFGEYMTIVSVEYDVEGRKTRVGLAYAVLSDPVPTATDQLKVPTPLGPISVADLKAHFRRTEES
jgi:hypothetical protein